MRVTVTFPAYNTRRYGRPWIARVSAWPVGKPPTLDWGTCIDGRTVEVDATPGEIVRWGQRDHRGGNTDAQWGIVQPDASVLTVTARIAREHWLATESSHA
jgi:hypothetical protein